MEKNSENKKDIGLLLAVTLLIIGIVLIFFPFNIFHGTKFLWFQLETEDYGKLGDFISGVTGPFISISAFILLYMTYKSQSEELRQSREILETQNTTLQKQQFETTFFNLLNLHHQIVNNIDLKPTTISVLMNSATPKIINKGRDCFVSFFNGLRRTYANIRKAKPETNEFSIVIEAYNSYYKVHQSDLGHYFRNLYHIIKFVDKSIISNKADYASLVRAQLSSHELLLLFYNGISEYGTKFKPLIEDYHLLKNMPQEDLIDKTHKDFYKNLAFIKT